MSEKQFTHKCPLCGRYHPCNGRGMEHAIFCPKERRWVEIIVGREGRQVGNKMALPRKE